MEEMGEMGEEMRDASGARGIGVDERPRSSIILVACWMKAERLG